MTIRPVEKSYRVCQRTGDVTYVHTTTINGELLRAAYTTSDTSCALAATGRLVQVVDEQLERQMLASIRGALYPRA